MAERRMFTQKIIDSDAFLDMPLSAQALYFHLNMRADDDGFVNNPKRIQRTISASEDDLKLLLLKRFVIGFESGVLVIKHWRMHNTLRKDRYNPTQYQEELAMLEVKDNNAYTERLPVLPEPIPETVATTWHPNGTQMEPQYRLGKDSIGKLSIGEGSMCDSDESAPPAMNIDFDSKKIVKDMADEAEKIVTCQQIVDIYHSICKSFPTIRTLSDARKKAIKARLNTYKLDDFKTLFEKAEASSFLKGSNDRNWTATFDWLIKDANMAKVLEGNYADKPKHYKRKEKVPGWMEYTMGQAELEAIEQLMKDDPAETVENNPELAAEADELAQRMQEKYGRKDAG